MAKTDQIIFVCSECGEEYLRWQGSCSNCGQWNTLKEFKISNIKYQKGGIQPLSEAIEIDKIKTSNFNRIATQIGEFDRVLGGYDRNMGIIPGSVILLGGEPGIGKSTLLLEVASHLDNVLYVSGEESLEQIKIRFDRLGLKNLPAGRQGKSIKLLSDIDLDSVIAAINKENPNLIIIDSIQSIYSKDFPSTPGSLVQVRECALRLQQIAKTTRASVILVGHVTKDGSVAGPKTLEHLVDVVLYLEGERFYNHRILRSTKNRFGTVDEIGIFEMSEQGLAEVANPSKLFLEERTKNIAGTVVTAAIEGSRALLVEVQALTTSTVFGYPQRRASGFDLNRLQLLVAVLQRRVGLPLGNQDVFINVVGGIKINEPAVDLAVAMAIASAFKAKAIDSKICVFGEVGLSGEIRNVRLASKRIAEAKRLGFTKFISSKSLEGAVRSYLV